MYYSCSVCGKLHPQGYKCYRPRQYKDTEEHNLRNTFDWHEKSRAIREKANGLCEVCRDKGVLTYDGLEVHHIDKLSANKDGLLDDYNLVCLCTKHHKEADRGEISKDYLRDLAERREAK